MSYYWSPLDAVTLKTVWENIQEILPPLTVSVEDHRTDVVFRLLQYFVSWCSYKIRILLEQSDSLEISEPTINRNLN